MHAPTCKDDEQAANPEAAADALQGGISAAINRSWLPRIIA